MAIVIVFMIVVTIDMPVLMHITRFDAQGACGGIVSQRYSCGRTSSTRFKFGYALSEIIPFHNKTNNSFAFQKDLICFLTELIIHSLYCIVFLLCLRFRNAIPWLVITML